MQSVEMIPFGLLAGFVDDKEVRITEIFHRKLLLSGKRTGGKTAAYTDRIL